QWHGDPRDLHSFPTRRSSDLVVAPDAEFKIVGIRPGEKLHEQMISLEDSYYTYEYGEHFKILPTINGWASCPKRIKDGKRVTERSEEHTSELQSRENLVCRLL